MALVEARLIGRFKTDLVSDWLLFPDDQPYRSQPPTGMNSRYRINHLYGSLIGWSAVNPEVGYVYECRWTNE